MVFNSKDIAKILLEKNYISKEDYAETIKNSEDGKKDTLSYLFESQLINKDIIGQAIAENYDMVYWDLNTNFPNQKLFILLPEPFAASHRVIAVKEDGNTISFATDAVEKKDKLLIILQQEFSYKKIKLFFSLTEDIDQVFSKYRISLQKRFLKILESEDKFATEVVSEILNDASTVSASDVHFEPEELDVVIRFRIDGILQEVGRIPREKYVNILNRIKVMAHLRIDEHFAAQDGAIRITLNERNTDLRVSIVPIIDGEKVAIRILSEYIRDLSLEDLGVSDQDEDILRKMYKRPYGMILTTGPTGSGKTTTLYSLVKQLNTGRVNITTIEDPVEYKIPGVNQIQVNQQTNLTFAKGLRSIVRQDPNIILVGEIRDAETVEIAINAALTGHLLLSTFHANDAASAIPRLLDMGAEPFLLASTLNLIIAQRLVRRICPSCRYSVLTSRKEIAKAIPDASKYFPSENITLYEGKGCEVCNGIGYKGRIGIFELISVSDEMQELMMKSPSSREILLLAKKQGAHTFFDDGINKVKTGLTTLSELIRVAPAKLENIYYEQH